MPYHLDRFLLKSLFHFPLHVSVRLLVPLLGRVRKVQHICQKSGAEHDLTCSWFPHISHRKHFAKYLTPSSRKSWSTPSRGYLLYQTYSCEAHAWLANSALLVTSGIEACADTVAADEPTAACLGGAIAWGEAPPPAISCASLLMTLRIQLLSLTPCAYRCQCIQ